MCARRFTRASDARARVCARVCVCARSGWSVRARTCVVCRTPTVCCKTHSALHPPHVRSVQPPARSLAQSLTHSPTLPLPPLTHSLTHAGGSQLIHARTHPSIRPTLVSDLRADDVLARVHVSDHVLHFVHLMGGQAGACASRLGQRITHSQPATRPPSQNPYTRDTEARSSRRASIRLTCPCVHPAHRPALLKPTRHARTRILHAYTHVRTNAGTHAHARTHIPMAARQRPRRRVRDDPTAGRAGCR